MIKHRLYLDPQHGKFKGVCAGLANYLGVPVLLVRIMVVLSLFFGLFLFTVAAYFILAWVLEPQPAGAEQNVPLSVGEQLSQLDADLQREETAVRHLERYVTSEAYSVRSRFRDL
ncbi:envelope stress response membrane protein PspC [Pantoea sp. 1.19]|uniref:envelope stress response membrane protein PspC n=1 Tax=Pantoea sp. 1.19 TaxID=1925589 RepID=UPI000949082A|nr:envelope stress response membrane protein PspC [Pantoea sp. 1.19]